LEFVDVFALLSAQVNDAIAQTILQCPNAV